MDYKGKHNDSQSPFGPLNAFRTSLGREEEGDLDLPRERINTQFHCCEADPDAAIEFIDPVCREIAKTLPRAVKSHFSNGQDAVQACQGLNLCRS